MEKAYKINPYAIVNVNSKGEYIFYKAPDGTNETVKLLINPNEKQKQAIGRLLGNEFIELSFLKTVFSDEEMDFLINNEILADREINTSGFYDRSNAFYERYMRKNCSSVLKKKRVLILGCGGLGSHLAWYMAVHGIGEITIVDFDIIEESNLNRQILYEQNDIGKKKVYALKEHIERINPYIKVQAIDRRISSLSDLREITSAEKFDLLVKALDSPNEMPMWVDEICREQSIPCVVGITLRNRALIGPTYIPNISELGWNDIFKYDEKDLENRVYGTIPSLGIILAHIACEMAQEALKILLETGNYKYVDIVVSKDILNGQEEVITSSKKVIPDKYKYCNPTAYHILCILLSICLSGYNKIFMIAALLFVLVLPLKDFSERKRVLKATFINTVAFVVGTMWMLIISDSELFGMVGKAAMVVESFIAMSVMSIVACAINYIVCSIRNRV